MRQFLKFMLASMLGTLLVGVVLIFLFIGMIAALGASVAMQGKPAPISERSVLHIKLDKPVVDRGSKDQFDLDMGPFSSVSQLGLNQILASLEHAKTDDRIAGIFLDLTYVDAGYATMREIREKLVEFKKESGKPVIAFSDTYTQGTYYLATAADSIYLQPKGDLDHRGLRSEYMFFKGMFEKLDIDVQFIRGRNNKFKSFGEMYTEDHMSPANREQNRMILAGLWKEHLDAIGQHTGLSHADLDRMAEQLDVRNAEDAAERGLVTGLKYRDEVLDVLKRSMDMPTDEDVEVAELQRYARTVPDERTGKLNSKLAVIYAEGSIMTGKSEDGTIGSTSLAATIREAREDSSIKAIVLRVNSPGGSGLASDVIWREVDLAKRVKPVVVSMGDVAASGGYYISAPATRIFAEPTTITGSIGVFGMIPNMKGFFNNKLGITFDGEKTHKYADMMTVSRPLSEEELAIVQDYVDEFYDGFKERVAEGRKMTVAQVDSIGQGRVWTGGDALRLGLVDELGGLEAAKTSAAELAGMSDYRVVELPKQKELIEQLLEDLNMQASMWVASTWMGEDVELLKQFKRAKDAKEHFGIQARMPYDIVIH
ncbi:MAG: signal peptide peptidase SppA [Flavobacteriales bacterium]|nr:signal peptide peptidase SppA [Flavobacteriales bacterium]